MFTQQSLFFTGKPPAPELRGSGSTHLGTASSSPYHTTVTIPTHAAGDLIVVVTCASHSTAPTASVNTTVSVGTWSYAPKGSMSSTRSGHIFQCVADGTNMSLDIDFTQLCNAVRSCIYVIKNADTARVAATVSTGTNSVLNPPNATVPNTRDVLWIAWGFTLNPFQTTTTGYPSGYGNLLQAYSTSNGSCLAATRVVLNDDAEDPGNFNGAVTGNWVGHTIGCYIA